MGEEKFPAAFGRYRITGKIAAGGMGMVLRAHDPKLDREVAVKAILTHLQASESVVERFRREALVLAKLSHPNIVRVFDVGSEQGMLYYVMELLNGRGLDERTHRSEDPNEELPPREFDGEEFLEVFTPLADALKDCHVEGIIHRDIKPANILGGVPNRGAVLTDFGLIHVDDAESLTREGTILGTARYMAPEQVRGEPADGLSDVYGLGTCMYEFATGRVPFHQMRGRQLLAARLVAEIPDMVKAAPQVPKAIGDVIDRSVKLYREERYQSAKDLHRALLRAAKHLDDPPDSVEASRAFPSSSRISSAQMSSARMSSPGMTSASTPSGTMTSAQIGVPDDTVSIMQQSAPRLILPLVLLLLAGVGGAFAVYQMLQAPAATPPPPASTATAAPELKAEPAAPPEPEPARQILVARIPRPATPLLLTTGSEIGRRVGLAAQGTEMAAVWVRSDGRIGVASGRKSGRSWSRPGIDGALQAHSLSELAFVATGGRYRLLFCAAGADGKPWIHTTAAPSDLTTWSTPVPLGPAQDFSSRVFLAISDEDRASAPMLATWFGPKGKTPSISWGSPRGDSWLEPISPPRVGGHGRVTAHVTAANGGLVVWHQRAGNENLDLYASRSEGPGKPWTEPAPLKISSSGFDRAYPRMVPRDGRLYMSWSENHLTSHPLVIGVSDDDGLSFQGLGLPWGPYNRDNRTMFTVTGDKFWVTGRHSATRHLVWTGSRDGGKQFTRFNPFGDTEVPDGPASLVTLPSSKAWVLWSNKSRNVAIAQLP